MTDTIKAEFTVKYWTDKAYANLAEAESIADALGESFYFEAGGYGSGAHYTPDPDNFFTKEVALALLASGKELDDFQKWAIQNAIDKDLTQEDTEGWQSSSGWLSSSQNC